MRLRRKVHDRLRWIGAERFGHRLRILDAAAHEAVPRLLRELCKVLLAPRVGELVEHRHRVPMLVHTHPCEM